jgi:formylaminopyrimidine deformylase / aminopyrimidine aminohydrolase
MHEFDRSALVIGAGGLWTQGTRGRFLDAVAVGSLPAEAFHRWLVQDYLFALGLTSFQAILSAKAPRAAHGLLIGGLAALHAELAWFEQHTERLQLDLHSSPHPICRRYVDFLLAAAYMRPVPVLLAILYGVEVSYLAAWSALGAQGPYAEFIARWSTPQFAEYVRGLLALVTRHPDPGQQEAFDDVLRHECDFWRMTWEG